MKEIEITKLGYNGEGVGRIDNKVCFVKYALPDEKVLVSIKQEKKDFINAKLEKVIKSSKNRENPPCPYYQTCGGCDIQHLEYQKQLEFKKQLIEETFKKIADLEVNVKDIYSDKQFEYRNKSVFAITEENGKVIAGMKQENSHSIIEIENCILQNSLANKILKIFKTFIKEKNIPCNTKNKSGVKYLVIRVIDDKALITIVSDMNIENLKDFAIELKKQNLIYGLYVNINKSTNTILSKNSTYLSGLKQLESEENGIKFYVSPNSFLQVNTLVQNMLYDKVVNYIKSNIVLDCYSGAGIMSAMFSKKLEKVYGIEIEKSATSDANILKQTNNLNNLTNINGDVKQELPKLISKFDKNVCVVLDPPRSGCDSEVLNLLCQNTPNEIIYISCLPRTLARDMNILKQYYDINEITAFDMFPNTKHVETLVYLTKKNR